MQQSVWDRLPSGRPDAEPESRRPRSRTPGPGETLVLVPLEDGVGWYQTHFLNKRTKPCLGELCPCQRADRPLRKRWQGYILALEMPQRKLVLALLSHNTWASCPELRTHQYSLRGAKLTLTRKGGAQGPIVGLVEPDFYPLSQVPVLPYGHKDQLLRVWFGGLTDYVEVAKAFEIEARETPSPLVESDAGDLPHNGDFKNGK